MTSPDDAIRRYIDASVAEALRTIEPWVRQQIAQALAAHTGQRPHLDDDDVQRIAFDVQLGPASTTGQHPVVDFDPTQTTVIDDPTATRRYVRSIPPHQRR